MSAEPPLLHPPSRQLVPAGLAVLCGAAGWFLVAHLAQRKEAWDSPLYFSLAYPAFGLVAFLLGCGWPGRPWRWALGLACGQLLVAFIRNPTASLLPLGLIVFAVYSAPLILPGWLGSRLRRGRDGG